MVFLTATILLSVVVLMVIFFFCTMWSAKSADQIKKGDLERATKSAIDTSILAGVSLGILIFGLLYTYWSSVKNVSEKIYYKFREPDI